MNPRLGSPNNYASVELPQNHYLTPLRTTYTLPPILKRCSRMTDKRTLGSVCSGVRLVRVEDRSSDLFLLSDGKDPKLGQRVGNLGVGRSFAGCRKANGLSWTQSYKRFFQRQLKLT